MLGGLEFKTQNREVRLVKVSAMHQITSRAKRMKECGPYFNSSFTSLLLSPISHFTHMHYRQTDTDLPLRRALHT